MINLTIFLSIFCVTTALAQGVKISGTPGTPDPSAGLDVDFANKGVLFPRITTAQRLAISNPAHGLLIYQTDAPEGFWYNAGSPSAPNWIQVVGTPVNTTIDMANNTIQNLPLPVNNSDAVNKAYVDALVASGGGTPGGIPTMMSSESPSGLTMAGATAYCANLNESGHTDWRLPTFDELAYFFGSSTSTNFVWTKTSADGKENPLNQNYRTARISDGKWRDGGEIISQFGLKTISGNIAANSSFTPIITFTSTNPSNLFLPLKIKLTGYAYSGSVGYGTSFFRLKYNYADGSTSYSITYQTSSSSTTFMDDTYPYNSSITPLASIVVEGYCTNATTYSTIQLHGFEIIAMPQQDGAALFTRCVR